MSASVSFEPLTPTAFLLRSGKVYADRIAVIDDERRYTYAEFLDRCLRLAGALRGMGVQDGGRVAVLAPNTHVLLEAHYGVPFAGAVLVALNPRLTAADLARIVAHSGAQVLIYDYELRSASPREIARARARACSWCAAGGPTTSTSDLLARRRALRRAGDGRARAPLDQLHERHDRRAQGRHVSPPRRLPAGARDGAGHAARLRQHLPVDAADVSLQRLVLHVGASPPRARRTCACASSIRRSSGGTCASPASRTSTARRRCSSCWRGTPDAARLPRPRAGGDRRRAADAGDTRAHGGARAWT